MPRKYGELFVEALLFVSAIASILIMVLIFYFLINESLPAFSELGLSSLLLGTKWHPAGEIYGLLPLIAASLISHFWRSSSISPSVFLWPFIWQNWQVPGARPYLNLP